MDVIRICRVNTVSRKQLKTQQEEHGVTGQHNKTTLHTSITSAAHQHGTKKKSLSALPNVVLIIKSRSQNQSARKLEKQQLEHTNSPLAVERREAKDCGNSGIPGPLSRSMRLI